MEVRLIASELGARCARLHSGPQGRKLLDRQPIVNNVAEDFVREPLAQGFHPRKVQNDLAKPIQPGSTAQQMLPATLTFKRQ